LLYNSGVPRKPHKVTTEKGRLNANQIAFLAAFSKLGTILAASKETGLARENHYKKWMNEPDYAAAFDEANRQFCEHLEQEIHERAVVGWREPVFHKGAICGEVLKKSDVLLIFMTKAKMPHYRDKMGLEHSGPDGGPIPIAALSKLAE
jgi:hypothetical protein